jgi:hypothetical protein
MSGLRLRIEGDVIPLNSFVAIMSDTIKILHDLERAIASRQKAAIEWVIQDLSSNSPITADIATRVVDTELLERVPDQVVDTYVSGLRTLSEEAHVPAWFSEGSLRKVQTVANKVGKGGVEAIKAFSLNGQVGEAAPVTRETAVNVASVLRPVSKAIGSIKGRLEVISLHKANRVTVYDLRTHRGIRCSFPDTQLDEVKSALGRVVTARGVIYRNASGDPVKVETKRFEIAPESLPTVDDLVGSDPDFTGGLTTEEYMERLRDG